MVDILTCYKRKSTGVTNSIHYGCFPFNRKVGSRVTVLGHLNETEPSLMLVIAPVLFLLGLKSKCLLKSYISCESYSRR